MADGVCWLTTAVIKEATLERKQEILRTKLADNPLAKEMQIIDSVSLRAVAVNLERATLTKRAKKRRDRELVGALLRHPRSVHPEVAQHHGLHREHPMEHPRVFLADKFLQRVRIHRMRRHRLDEREALLISVHRRRS